MTSLSMRRGEVWTLRDRNCASKARPVVVAPAEQGDEDGEDAGGKTS